MAKGNTVEKNLEKFLRKNKILTKFKKNHDMSFNSNHEATNIKQSFVWTDTPEGFKFWKEINNKFLKEIINVNKRD